MISANKNRKEPSYGRFVVGRDEADNSTTHLAAFADSSSNLGVTAICTDYCGLKNSSAGSARSTWLVSIRDS